MSFSSFYGLCVFHWRRLLWFPLSVLPSRPMLIFVQKVLVAPTKSPIDLPTSISGGKWLPVKWAAIFLLSVGLELRFFLRMKQLSSRLKETPINSLATVLSKCQKNLLTAQAACIALIQEPRPLKQLVNTLHYLSSLLRTWPGNQPVARLLSKHLQSALYLCLRAAKEPQILGYSPWEIRTW